MHFMTTWDPYNRTDVLIITVLMHLNLGEGFVSVVSHSLLVDRVLQMLPKAACI